VKLIDIGTSRTQNPPVSWRVQPSSTGRKRRIYRFRQHPDRQNFGELGNMGWPDTNRRKTRDLDEAVQRVPVT
jgi:hypothetical protein